MPSTIYLLNICFVLLDCRFCPITSRSSTLIRHLPAGLICFVFCLFAKYYLEIKNKSSFLAYLSGLIKSYKLNAQI